MSGFISYLYFVPRTLYFEFLLLSHTIHNLIREDKIVQLFYPGVGDVVFVAFPELLPFVDEEDLFADPHYGVHVVGYDDGGHIVVFGEILDEVVDEDGGLRIEA